jgi:CPA2 family monovalent cation:H+ antiporter-2
MPSCPHLEQLRDVKPRTKGCEDCLKTGDLWNQLRVCLTCGYVGCCDDSRNQHATKHFHQTQHPLIRSLEPGEHWVWCYPDKLYFEKVPGLGRRTPWSLLTGWLRR